MARRRGGYQRPAQPAAASGPGAMSQRTDGRVPQLQRTGLPYGENQAVNEQQSAAPISPPQQGTPGGEAAPRSRPALPPDGIFGPTDRPEEPPTAGVDFGPGKGQTPLPALPDDVNYKIRAIVAADREIGEYLLGLLD